MILVCLTRLFPDSQDALDDMKGLPEALESLYLAVLDNQLVSLSHHLERLQTPCQQVGLEQLQASKLHRQILLFSVIVTLLGI